MASCLRPEPWIARAQVGLGTLVEVALPAHLASEMCFSAAFAAIAHVQRTMSAHDPASDLARIACDAHLRTVVVDADTFAVLTLAREVWCESGGAFDVTIAPALARRGLLPPSAIGSDARCGRMDALQLEPGFGVRSTVPISLDLGGIAKGFAVDCAVAALRAAGAHIGLVNAGGDLRAFGADTWIPVHVRHPGSAAHALQLFDIRDAAVATSADYFRAAQGALVEPRTQSVQPFSGSVTVVAPTCALADALTKIVALRPEISAALLTRYGAHAFTIDPHHPQEGVQVATTCTATTANLRFPLAVAA